MSGLASIALAASMSSCASLGGRPPVRPARRAAARPAWVRLPDQAAYEFRQRAKHVKNKPTLRRRRVESFGQAAKTDASHS